MGMVTVKLKKKNKRNGQRDGKMGKNRTGTF